MPSHTDLEPARTAPIVDGEVICWRCSGPADPDDGYCPACGAVTIPAGDDPSRTPANTTSSTSAIGRQPIAAALDLEPLPLNALDPLALARGFGCEV